MPKLFTIITVVKNNAVNICCTIESVLLQKYQNFEYVIIDGFSDDGTSELIKKNYHKNKNIKYFRYKDSGIYDALNFALKKATGKYVGIIHSGD
ncbi:glycosyltransferase, partial [Candidatus Pelagibacter sp.]|nr:glycosyltransferase [Candidatus Pelagibacter sp.]